MFAEKKRNVSGLPGIRSGFGTMVAKDWKLNKGLYLLVLPFIAHYLIFKYVPMYGLQMAFQNFSPAKGFTGSPWVGFHHFISFFESFYFWRTLKNTLILSFYSLVFTFPAPILMALLLNELKHKLFKRITQTITYLPYFISLVVICGMIKDFTTSDGLINDLVVMLGGQRSSLIQRADMYRLIHISTSLWQSIGWNSIIYLAAISSIDPQLYEASKIDGARRFKQLIHVTLPGISNQVIILLILALGNFMNVDTFRILLLYSPPVYETADVIGTYVYRQGILNASYSYSAAIGLVNTVINFVLVISFNKLSRKVSETSLW